MMMRALFSVVCFVIVAGCSSEESVPIEEPTDSELPASASVVTDTVVEFGIGDVETGIQMVLTMNETLVPDEIMYQELETKKYEIAIVKVKVSKPYPESIPLLVKFRRWNKLPEHAVLVFPRLYVDDVKVADLEGLEFGGDTIAARELPLELMDYMDEVPESALVHLEADYHLFLGAGDAGVTLETPVGPETQSVVKLSNPMRIDFQP